VYRTLLQPAWTASGRPSGICSSVDEFELDADANKSSDEVVEHNKEVPGEGDADKDIADSERGRRAITKRIKLAMSRPRTTRRRNKVGW
jgi:hypothetical protein